MDGSDRAFWFCPFPGRLVGAMAESLPPEKRNSVPARRQSEADRVLLVGKGKLLSVGGGVAKAALSRFLGHLGVQQSRVSWVEKEWWVYCFTFLSRPFGDFSSDGMIVSISRTPA